MTAQHLTPATGDTAAANSRLVAASLSQWRAREMVTVLAMRDDLVRVADKDRSKPEFEIVKQRLALAESILLRSSRMRSRRRWFTGSDPELVLGAFATAGQAMTALVSEEELRATLPDLRSSITAYLPDNTVAAQAVDHLLADVASIDRSQLREIRRAVDDSRVEAMAHVKNFQNKLLVLSAVLACGLAVVTAVQALDPTRIPLLMDGVRQPQAWDAFEVMVLGSVGGAFAALIAAAGQRGYRGPYSLGLTQSLVKLPAGAATALIGVLLLQHGLVGVQGPQSREVALAYAALFGYAQQLGTRLLDQKGEEMLQAARSKHDPAKQKCA